MKIREILLHNFRSIEDQSIRLGDYSLLIGANNSGKTNLIDALRIFYEKELKFDFDRDFPKFATKDNESWMEVEYQLSFDEAPTIKPEYLFNNDRFRIRKWLDPQDKTKQGLFGFEGGKLSENLFYGWKNVAQGKLGKVIYIPPVSRLEEHTKLTGPSALRDLINDILKPIIRSSASFKTLSDQFKAFGAAIKNEETADKRSLSGLEQKVNEEIQRWGATFNLEVLSPQEDDIIKGLIRHSVTDRELNQALESGSFGHGFQRHLIFTLIRVSASYMAPKAEPKKKEFSPELELLLFEEPEAFIHPPQQDILDKSLRKLSTQVGRQVLAATHSSIFVSSNADDVADLVHLVKAKIRTEVGQVSPERLKMLFQENVMEMQEVVKDKGGESETPIGEDIAGELEAVRHFLWLNPDRSNLFFADHVLIVEGLSEQVLVNYLLNTDQIPDPGKGIYVLECYGKFYIPRFMKLCEEMKIPHAVLYDLDADKAGNEKIKQDRAAEQITRAKNESTVGIDFLPENLEKFLGLNLQKKERWKASKVLLTAQRGEIDAVKLGQFRDKVAALLGTTPW